MKLGLFSDPHYSSQEVTCGCRYNNRSLDKMREAYKTFSVAECDLILCLGDLIDREDDHQKEIANLQAAAEVIHSVDIPTVCVMGNHDAFAFTSAEFYAVLGDCEPKDRVIDGKTLLFLDACHFQSGRHYAPGDNDWTDTCLPNPVALEQALAKAIGEVYVFLHQNIDPDVREDHRLHNDDEVRHLLEQSGKVKAVYQGHYHPGYQSHHGGIDYVTLPAMCEQENAYYIMEA